MIIKQISYVNYSLNKETPKLTNQPSAIIKEIDYSSYFNNLDGCAAFYTPSKHEYKIYNMKLANKLIAPCSTFKIISSLLALENNIIDPQNSVRKWSGEKFKIEDWNRDIDFTMAFKTSCMMML